MILKNLILIFILIGKLSSASVGLTSGDLLSRNLEPTILTKGNTLSVSGDGIVPIFYNPAGMNFANGKELIFLNSYEFGDVNLIGIGYGMNIKNEVLGLSIIDKIVSGVEDVDGSKISVYDLMLIIGYKKNIIGDNGVIKSKKEIANGEISTGINLKMFNSKLASKSALAFLGDLGFIYKNNDIPLKVGIVLKNLGTKIKYEAREENAPLLISAGLSYKLFYTQKDNQLEIGFNNIYYPRENYFSYSFGLEYFLFRVISLRAGYIINSERNLGNFITFGIGAKVKRFELNYGFKPMFLDNFVYSNHLISFKITFYR